MIIMGCGGSKVDDLPLVIRCRERKELIKAAADHRYVLASAHVAYFRSLADVGDALRRFVDEELLLPSPSASPVLTLPSDEAKTKKNKNKNTKHIISSSSSTSIAHSGSGSHIHLSDDDDDNDNDNHNHDGDGSHLNLASGSNSELGSDSSGHIHMHNNHHNPDLEFEGPPMYSSQPPQRGWDPHGGGGGYPPPQTNWGSSYGGGGYPPPQTNWGSSYGGVYPPPQTDLGSSYGVNPSGGQYPQYPPPQSSWDPYGGNTNTNSTSYAYYMKRSDPQIRSVIYDPTKSAPQGQGPETTYSYSTSYSSYPYENSGFFGFPMSSPPRGTQNEQQPSPPAGPPPPPPPPNVSAWDFLNPFDGFDSGYPGYYSYSRYAYGSVASSPDSNEVREREGIPDLEDETETETYREFHKGKNLNEDVKKNSGEGTSRAVPSQKQSSEGSSRQVHSKKQSSEGSLRTVPSNGNSEGTTKGFPPQNSEGISREAPSQNPHSVEVKEEKSSPDTIISKSTEDGSVRKRGVAFEVDATPMQDTESSKLSNLTTLSAYGTRDVQEVVTEIRDEFVTASSYGKEVAMLLEVGKLPYQPRFALLKVILSRILYMVAPSLSSSHPPSRHLSTLKLAKTYYEDSGKNPNIKPSNLSSTLEKLYVWEKKLYKEVKDEERLRVIYEKQCKRLKALDDRGAESSKIDATQALIRKLLTKLNVCIKAVDAISSRIHKLRDEELQPQVAELIYGLIRMWKTMLKCHQKQFQAIMESKTRRLRPSTGSRGNSSLRATAELEMELRTWRSCFTDWIHTQKSFIESLNEWLLRCLLHEPEETADGIVPFSPGRIGAPQIFVICNDWSQAMETISESGVANAMHNFASSLQQLWEKQGEDQRHRLKAQYLSKDLEKRLRTLRMERGKMERDQDAASLVPSDSGVSLMDDLKVDLDSMRERLKQERARHIKAAKLVHDAASGSLQAGLIPIFEALGNFTSKTVKAYEHVRIQNAGQHQYGR